MLWDNKLIAVHNKNTPNTNNNYYENDEKNSPLRLQIISKSFLITEQPLFPFKIIYYFFAAF
jgi:hypothetical protein